MSFTEIKKIVSHAHDTGMPNLECAKLLNKQGLMRNARGVEKPWDAKSVSVLALKMGLRKRGVESKKKKAAPLTPPPSTSEKAITKWDVLKAIESCADLSQTARKALLGLVWQELQK